MFDDYKEAVRDFYLIKKEKNQLSDNLVNLERSKLRKECLKVFRERYTNKDDEVLRLFFDPFNEINDHVKSIKKIELDKFRPLVSFLQEETKIIRDEEAIKLFAWLIDFEAYQDWRPKQENGQMEDPKDLPDANDNRTGPNKEEVPDNNQNGDSPVSGALSVKDIILICIALLLIGTGVFFLPGISIIGNIRQPSADEKCMYWTGDHYEPAKCDARIKDATLVPINLRTLNNLRRINLADTLTKHSLGKVWYSKIGGRHEFFTDSGVCPMDTLKRLRPLTTYILKNHVFYHRYLLICLMWSIGVIITVVLCIGCVIYLLRRERKVRPRTFRGFFDVILQRYLRRIIA